MLRSVCSDRRQEKKFLYLSLSTMQTFKSYLNKTSIGQTKCSSESLTDHLNFE